LQLSASQTWNVAQAVALRNGEERISLELLILMKVWGAITEPNHVSVYAGKKNQSMKWRWTLDGQKQSSGGGIIGWCENT
jgi:hypothetical protein